ncbi:hypothetical protein RIEGSTA812A_PEG_485 [invertebrate metagenome]|uniref:Uncharacterized protein n=1 Tax=invertebrate metagenome TaxID=1711999 RepID=A0A484HB58_9ZZZZ
MSFTHACKTLLQMVIACIPIMRVIGLQALVSKRVIELVAYLPSITLSSRDMLPALSIKYWKV